MSAADRYLWARAGASHPVLPFASDAPVSLWLGLEGTTSGTFESRHHEVGPVAELPLRDLDAVLTVRAAVPVRQLEALGRPGAAGALVSEGTLGLGAYWSY